MSSVTDCLNFIDRMIVCNIEKHAGIGKSGNIRAYMIGMYNDKNIEEVVALLSILSQTNLIIKILFRQRE